MKMIDVGAKPKTERVAVARGFVAMSRATVKRRWIFCSAADLMPGGASITRPN